jgi:MSHA biogenesis protein MshP
MRLEAAKTRGQFSFKKSGQSGFAIVTAIFLILLFAALIALMLTLSGGQNVNATQDVRGSQAYQAARAGIEWGSYQFLINGNCTAATTMTFTGLDDFNVTVTGTAPAGPPTEGGKTLNICSLTSLAVPATALSPGNRGYVERALQATVER